MTTSNPSTTHTMESVLTELRLRGWTVAVHNDYRINGGARTFWLLTHPSGRWIKGEHYSDVNALLDCLNQADRYALEALKPAITGGVDMSQFYIYQPPLAIFDSCDPNAMNTDVNNAAARAQHLGKRLLILVNEMHLSQSGRASVQNNKPTEGHDLSVLDWVFKADHLWLVIDNQITVLKSRDAFFQLSAQTPS